MFKLPCKRRGNLPIREAGSGSGTERDGGGISGVGRGAGIFGFWDGGEEGRGAERRDGEI